MVAWIVRASMYHSVYKHFSDQWIKSRLRSSENKCDLPWTVCFLYVFKLQDSTDGKAAALYLEDPGTNPVVGMKNMRHPAACLM